MSADPPSASWLPSLPTPCPGLAHVPEPQLNDELRKSGFDFQKEGEDAYWWTKASIVIEG